MIVALVALFVSLSGNAAAVTVTLVTSKDIKDRSICATSPLPHGRRFADSAARRVCSGERGPQGLPGERGPQGLPALD
jgi:hypothetical protein